MTQASQEAAPHCQAHIRAAHGDVQRKCPPTRSTLAPPITRTGVAIILGSSPLRSWERNWVRLPSGYAPCRNCTFYAPLPGRLLDGPTADLQALGQFPLAHSLRPLHPDVFPLLLGQARLSARETALGPRLRLARDRALPDRVPPPLAEGEHHRELELAGGCGRVEVFRQGLINDN